MSEDLIGRAREIDKQLPKAPWDFGQLSASQADIIDAEGSWVGTVRKDFDRDEDEKPLIVELRNMLPDLLAAFSRAKATTDSEIAEIEKWSRWSLQPDITTDGETLKNAIGHVAALLKIVHRQSAEIETTKKKFESFIKSDVERIKKHIGRDDQDEMKDEISRWRLALARSIAVTDEKIAEGEQWRDKWRKAVAEQTANRIEIERLQNALEATGKKLADLREVDAATCRDVTRCADKCANLRGKLDHLRSELTIAGEMILKVRAEANAQRARAEAVEMMLAAKQHWQTEAPTPGRWRVSIRPEIRRGFPPVVECEVWPSPDGLTVNYRPGSSTLPFDQDWFIGAKWQRIQRVEEVADPFA
jgi:chromosome segregation ATPase